ncbi:hypothetical protein [Amaricoccus sp.]|nr:hypothetical protein [Amaricoccus sp.]
MALLTGGTNALHARAASCVRAPRVDRVTLPRLTADLPEVSDIAITVFAARRRRPIEQDAAGLLRPPAD